MDIALIALLFVFLGWLVDRWLGTQPVFIIALSMFALIGQGVRMYYVYENKMRALEAERAAATKAATKTIAKRVDA